VPSKNFPMASTYATENRFFAHRPGEFDLQVAPRLGDLKPDYPGRTESIT